MLYVGRMKRRFLSDQNGYCTAVELDCLRAKCGTTDNVLEEYPDDKKDVYIFPARCIISKPFSATFIGGRKWEVKNYDQFRHLFRKLERVNCAEKHDFYLCQKFADM